MKSFVALLAAGMLCVAAVGAHAQENPFDFFGKAPAIVPETKVLDADGLSAMLTNLGYTPEKVPVSGVTAFRVTLKHSDGTRTTMVAIDNVTGNVVIVGGGFASYPDVTRASAAWYRK